MNSLNGSDFPVGIEFSVQNGIYKVYLLPLSVLEVIDFIRRETFLVFNVDANEYDGIRPLTLAEIVSEYSSFIAEFDEETLLIDRKSVIELLNEISHYNFCLIDVEREIDIDQVIEIIDLSAQPFEITITDRVGANVFLSSHDDCYLYVETKDAHFALDLISLLIKTLVSTVSNIQPSDLKFNPKELTDHEKFSVIIPQNPVKTPAGTNWKIFDATFKDYIYNSETIKSDAELIYSETDQTIHIKKSEVLKTPD